MIIIVVRWPRPLDSLEGLGIRVHVCDAEEFYDENVNCFEFTA